MPVRNMYNKKKLMSEMKRFREEMGRVKDVMKNELKKQEEKSNGLAMQLKQEKHIRMELESTV